MRRLHKVWGERWLLREDSTHAVSYLILKQKTRCSWHRHQTKYNLFVVVSGHVGIRTEHGEIELRAGESFTVEPGLWHEFRAYQWSTMIEEMYVEYSEADIEREKIGGTFECR